MHMIAKKLYPKKRAMTKVMAGIRLFIADANVAVVKANVSKYNVCANVPLDISFIFMKRYYQYKIRMRSYAQ